MNFCNLHTILRLPTGIFYAQGVKTNVLFFTRGVSEKGNTKEVAFYDMRTNMDSFGKTRTLRPDDFDEFVEIIEFKDEYNNLQYKLIPAIENEIKIIETQGKFISNAKDDLKKLKESYNEVKELISKKENHYKHGTCRHP
jgi:type I restriction-modification system DNA methylase subunit